MIPDNVTSDKAHIAGFTFPVKTPLPEDKLQDWELGGVALNDASQGLKVKVWHCILEIERETGDADVYVEAPGVTKTLLFSGNGITEVALAFDQNMQPFIAYQQGADAKIYWYDPTVTSFVHTTLPAGSYNLRCTLDDKRQFNIADSDIVLCYLRAGTLYMRYQRDRYTIEYTLKTGCGANAKLVSMAMNKGSRMQWRLRNYENTSDPNALIQAEPYLADVVEQINVYSGIEREAINVSGLYPDTVPGLKIDIDEGMDKPIDWLREIFFFDKAERNKKLEWVKRGGDVVARIPYKHLVEGTPTALKQTLADEKKLPRVLNVNHIDPDAGHARNKQTAERRSNLIHTDVSKTIDTQVVLTVDQAATAAMTRLKVYYNELIEYEFSTTLRYTELTVTDIIEVEDEKGAWHRMRLEERNEDSKIIEWTATQDAGSIVYGKTRTGQSLPPPISTTPGIVGETQIEIIDVSPLYDQDDELGLYVAAAGVTGSTWRGYQLLVSVDEGASYSEAASTDVPSTIGETVTDLLDQTGDGHDFSSILSFEVTTNFPLSSVSASQILAGANRYAIGAEVGQFETATLLGTVGTLYHYELSGLHRAKYGTEALLWPAGTRFVLLDDTVLFIRAQRAMVGVDLEYKPVSYGKSVDDTIPTDYLFDDPESQKEWPPDDVTPVRDGITNDVVVTFTGRPRLGQFGTPFHSKYFRGYRVKFSDATVIDTMTETATYANAPIGVTVQVCGLNEITGEGVFTAPVAT